MIYESSFNFSDPDSNPTAYTLLPKTTPNLGYIETWDPIEYDFVNDWLQFRSDNRGNEFRYSKATNDNWPSSMPELPPYTYSAITLFQWGNDNWYDNKINEAVINQQNSFGTISGNILQSQSSIYLNTLTASSQISSNVLQSQASIFSNTLADSAQIGSNVLSGLLVTIDSNNVHDNSQIFANNINGALSSMSGNVLEQNTQIAGNTIVIKGYINNNTLHTPDASKECKITENFINNFGGIANKTLAPSTVIPLTDVIFSGNTIGIDIDQVETITDYVNIQFKRAEHGFSNFPTLLTIDGSNTIDVTPVGYCGIINIAASGTIDTITIPVPPPGSTTPFALIQNFRIQPASTGVTVTFNSITATNIKLIGATSSSVIFTLDGANGDYCDFWTDGTTVYQNSPANIF